MAGYAGKMNRAQAVVIVAAELRLLLRPGRRSGPVAVAVDGTSSLGHMVQSLGIPLTKAGRLLVNGELAGPGYRPGNADVVTVEAVRRPQQLTPARFVLDVHLGTLARRLRLAGVDAAYVKDADDDALIEQANAGRRMLLTETAACSAAGPCGWAPTCGAPAPTTSSGTAGPVQAAAGTLDPVPGVQRAAVPGGQGSRGPRAASRHPAHLPDVRPLPQLRPGVLARRPQHATRADHRLGTPRR